MNDLIKTEKKNEDYVEAELLDGKYEGPRRENSYAGQQPPPESGNLFFRALDKARKAIFTFLFLTSFALILLGAIFSITFIGAIIGIPLILIGVALLFISIRLFSGKIIIR